MIFWATLLSFMIMLMTYMFYPYVDRIKTEYLPSSEAYVANFVTQHQAAKDFMREGLAGINKIDRFADLYDGAGVAGSVYILSGENGEPYLAEFLSRLQSMVTSSNFQPVDGFVSVLACFNHPERKYTDTSNPANVEVRYFENGLRDCRTTEAQTKYVFTYGWLPDYSNEPFMRNKTLLWETAILKRTHGNPDCGFLYKSGDRYFVSNSSRLTRTVPNSFMALLLLDSYLPTGASRRIRNDAGSSFLFCMTPANDPYPRKGMVANYDAVMNTGLPGEHSATLNGSWFNLFDGTEAIVTGSGNWHNLVTDAPEWETFDKGFSFDGSRTVKTTTKSADLGANFTISFRALFKEGNYELFNSQICTPEPNKPCLSAKYENGKVIVTLTRDSGEPFSVEGVVSKDTITQIDYVASAGWHKLFIEGSEAENETFKEGDLSVEIAGLSGDEIVLGGTTNKWNGTLYNFLIYNRSINAGDYENANLANQQEKFDVQGLARIHKTNAQRYNYQVKDVKKTGILKEYNTGYASKLEAEKGRQDKEGEDE